MQPQCREQHPAPRVAALTASIAIIQYIMVRCSSRGVCLCEGNDQLHIQRSKQPMAITA
jgi:hypothetical protein